MPHPVTMKAVATAAGVHQTTVSLALRDHASIPPATRARIKDLALTLGYQVNPLVSALISSRHRAGPALRRSVIGYVSADPPAQGGAEAIHAYPDLIAGARARAEELGYGLDHLWVGDPSLTRARFSQITTARGIHGIIVAPLADARPALAIIDWDRFAAVAYGYSLAEPALHRVAPDFYHAMLALLHRLRAAGWRRLGLVLDDNNDRKCDHLWLAAYLADQRLGPADSRLEPLLLPHWDPRAMQAWFDYTRPEIIISLRKMHNHIGPWLCAQPAPIAREVQLVGLQRLIQDATPWPGIALERETVGAICVDFVVAMLHRNERGIPAHAQNVLVSTGWLDVPPLRPAPSRAAATH